VRYAQAMPGQMSRARSNCAMTVDVHPDEPRSFTPFAWVRSKLLSNGESVFERASLRGKLAANTVAQYALWLNEATPAQHDRLIRCGRTRLRDGASAADLYRAEAGGAALHSRY